MYPIAVNLKGKHCVVIGGGRVAERRVAGLRDQGAQVTLIAPEITLGLQALAEAATVHWNRSEYRNELLQGAFLVIAATDSRTVNAAVARDAQERGLLVCCADGYEDGNFTTPAVIRRGDLTLTVTTGGQSPTLTMLLRERLAAEFGPEWEALTALLGRLRGDIQRVGDEAARRTAVQRILDDAPIRDSLRVGDTADAETRVRTFFSPGGAS